MVRTVIPPVPNVHLVLAWLEMIMSNAEPVIIVRPEPLVVVQPIAEMRGKIVPVAVVTVPLVLVPPGHLETLPNAIPVRPVMAQILPVSR